jgi:hypothetical protein
LAADERLHAAALKRPFRMQDVSPTTVEVLRMRLVGANAQARIMGLDEFPSKGNYFIGKDIRKWRAGVPTYRRVKYANVYPGVDLVYYGNQHQLEYDFVVHPGADPTQIDLSFEGADPPRLDANGCLVLRLGDIEVIEHRPVVYQKVEGGQRPIAGSFALKDGNRVGFELAPYDHHRSLTIDPSLVYSTYLGGSYFDSGTAIAVDSTGSAYIAGSTSSSDFPTDAGALQINYRGGFQDAFVTKLNRSGSAIAYSTYLGGTNFDDAEGIAVDSSGNAYITGSTESDDFPTTAGAFQATFGSGSEHVFVTKLNSNGSALVYSTYLGGRVREEGRGIVIGSLGNAYVTGLTESDDFPVTEGAFQTKYGGNGLVAGDAFVTQLNKSGSALIYSTFLGGKGGDYAGGIALDSSGDAYIIGTTGSSNFPITAGTFQTKLGGGDDAFVTKLNCGCSALVYSTYLGGSSSELGFGVAVDSSGNAYVAGETESANFPVTAQAFQTTYGGNLDAFVTKLNTPAQR